MRTDLHYAGRVPA